jgi:hypothetical protein
MSFLDGLNFTKLIPGALDVASSLLGMEGANTQAAGLDLQAQGALLAGSAARLAGSRKRVALQFEADQIVQQGGNAMASAERAAEEERRAARLLASRALAVAGASGASASDPSVVNLISRVAGEGAYRGMVKLYQGQEQKRVAMMQAAGRRYEGAVAEEIGAAQDDAYQLQAQNLRRGGDAARSSGVAGLVRGASGLFAKYGGAGPGATPTGETGGGGGSDYDYPDFGDNWWGE